MVQKLGSFFSSLFILLLLAVAMHSCANMAAPTGGAYDIDPPKVRRATPEFNSLNVAPTRIEIEFDENIKIESPNDKVIITPPQRNMPVIRSIGRTAVVELNDTLFANTTYTIDFTDAIVDNNEGNPLENFVYSFSTGDQIDTLSISGKVLNAEDLEPVPGAYVGIHSNLHDSAFTSIPFDRISRTDSRGAFTVRGMSPGKYRVFALQDMNRDYRYDNPLEGVAFLDSLVIPSTIQDVRQDTIFADSVTVDSILTVEYTRFLPDDLVLRTFLSDFQRMYLQKHERIVEHKLGLFFASPTDLPSFSLLDPPVEGDDWFVMERSAGNDTLTLWVTDSLIFRQDSLQLQLNYARTDSLNQVYLATDTLNFTLRRGRTSAKAEPEEEEGEVPIQFLGITSNVQPTFELYNPIRILFDEPVLAFDSTRVELLMEVDSLFEPIPFRLETDSLNPRRFVLRPRWEPGAKYRMRIDSAAIMSHYGHWNNTFDQQFTVKSVDQYGNLEISLAGLPDTVSAFVELLDNTGKPFRKGVVQSSRARFQDLPPGEIYARLVIDTNNDGRWTTGNYEENRQPEEVFYYPGKFVIRAYSDHSESWNILSTPLIEQKPLEITVNKPEERRVNPNIERERQQQQGQQQGSPFGMGGGMGGGIGGPASMQTRTGGAR